MINNRDSARVLLKYIEAEAKQRIEQAGGRVWSKVGDDKDGVALVIKIVVPAGTQTDITEFVSQEE